MQRSRTNITEGSWFEFQHGYRISWQVFLSFQANAGTDSTYEWATAAGFQIPGISITIHNRNAALFYAI